MPFVLSALTATCGRSGHLADDYRRFLSSFAEQSAQAGLEARTIARSGPLEIKLNNFFYAGADGRVVSAGDLNIMDPGVRALTLKKELLRRSVVEDGIKDGLYSSPDAAAYVLPRLEKILEEYYYYRKGGFARLAAESEKFAPDDAALSALLKSDPKLARSGAGMADLKRERERLVQKIAERRMEEERQKIIGEFLKSHPPLEVLP
ncbi:MAG: hypothetical protein HY042_06570 [Spirochaetia bacterium]|nr:hypothetical protein [Spirochaetia bacterium]